MIHVCLEKKIAIKATQVHIKVKIMYFYLLLFFSKAIFWGEDWDPQKMLGTPIWSDMWVPGPRMKNPSAIPVIIKEFRSILRAFHYLFPLRDIGERIQVFVCRLKHLWRVPGKTKLQQRMLNFERKHQ